VTYSIDHVVMAVPDLDRAAERLRRVHGLGSLEGGVHPRWGTANRIVPFGADYVELLSVVDATVAARTTLGRALIDLTADGRDRWFVVCLADTDLDATARRLGLAVEPGARARPDGVEVRWRGAGLESDVRDAWLPFFIEWQVPHRLHPGRMTVEHDVAVAGIDGVDMTGSPQRLRDWLGPGAAGEVPLEVVDGDPGIHTVRLATASGASLAVAEG
jgi:Glyoxalase-like domain